jgi:asparagine synthase (glutamine-hydrolysing)
MRALPMTPAQQYLDWVAVFPPAMLRAGYTPDTLERLSFDEPTQWFDALFDSIDAAPAERAAWTDLHSYLPYDLLTKVDIASMAVSLECRCPFLDHELVEFAFSLPLQWRIGRLGGKHILKDWAAGLLPPEVLRRGKQGFGVPIGEWFRRDLRDMLESRLLAADSLTTSLFRRPWIESLLAEHQSARANHEHRLWALLMLELWRTHWADAAY